MSANDWHSHAAQVRPLHPVPTPRAETMTTTASTGPARSDSRPEAGADLAADLTALTRVLLGLGATGSADLAPAAAESFGSLVAAAEPVVPAVTLHAPEPVAAILPPLPDVDLPPFESVVPVAPVTAPVEAVAVPSVAVFEEQAFRPQPIVEVEPLVAGLPDPGTGPAPAPSWEEPEDIGSLVVLEPDLFAPPAPPQQRAVVLDDLAFLDS